MRQRPDRIFELLLKRFGPQFWWPADHPWEMMVGAILVQNTAWTNVKKAMVNLQTAGVRGTFPSVKVIASMPRRKLEKLIRPSGYFRQKARRLQEFAKVMAEDREFYRACAGRAASRPPLHFLRDRLLSLHGIGPETADSMLLYAGDHPIFVVDTYTRRIGRRVGLFRTDRNAAIQAYFEARLPHKAALYNELHALLVRLAKTHCTKRAPRCGDCPLLRNCRYGQKKAHGVIASVPQTSGGPKQPVIGRSH